LELKDGRARVSVVLHTSNALSWALKQPITDIATDPLSFGYRPAELLAIFGRMAAAGDYELDPGAGPVLTDHFRRVSGDVNFGNARDARLLFEKARTAQSQRLRTLGRMPAVEELRGLHVADVEAAISR